MLALRQAKGKFTKLNIVPPSENNFEDISKAYQCFNGWEPTSKNNVIISLSKEDLLEIIDTRRIPITTKKLKGVTLTEKEKQYLFIMENLTNALLDSIYPVPKEKEEVTSAFLHLKSIISKHNGKT